MPLYTFECKTCAKRYESLQKLAEFTGLDTCSCGQIASAIIVPGHGGFKINQGKFYSTSFGREFKSEREQLAFARDHGHVPIGDEPPEKVAARMDRVLSEKLDAPYPDFQERVELTTQ